MKVNRRELMNNLKINGIRLSQEDFKNHVEIEALRILRKSRSSLSFKTQRLLSQKCDDFTKRARKLWGKYSRHFDSTPKHPGFIDDEYFNGDMILERPKKGTLL